MFPQEIERLICLGYLQIGIPVFHSLGHWFWIYEIVSDTTQMGLDARVGPILGPLTQSCSDGIQENVPDCKEEMRFVHWE